MSEALSQTGSKKRRWYAISPMTRRVLAVNMVPLVLLVSGLLYLDEYRSTLVERELDSLHVQAQMFAAALAEGAVVAAEYEGEPDLEFPGAILQPMEAEELDLDVARNMVRRLAEPAGIRARLFSPHENLLADSRVLYGPSGMVEVEELPLPAKRPAWRLFLQRWYEWLSGVMPVDSNLPVYRERHQPKASDFPEAQAALEGDDAQMVRADPEGGLVLSVAVPVQHYKHVVGALLLSKDSSEMEQSLFDVRLTILQMSLLALFITVLLSIYLAGAIASPLKRLALEAEQVRTGHGRRHHIPRFPGRHDEISDLAHSLADMTEALWLRMDAIEAFAADVAHEIKNPLTSLRSAVETVVRIPDPERQKRLLAIILDDVQRLDRLISDISDASRLDAELSRAETKPVALRPLIETLIEIHNAADQGPRLEASLPEGDDLVVPALESRIAQVLRNLIANALSFSPPGGAIRLEVQRTQEGGVTISVEDEGPGIPEGKFEAIFQRFYTERPQGEKFGTHSGLGLSISRQIVEAHGGHISTQNRLDLEGRVLGARFTVQLPG
jgi:two-component system sensor histidine kinase ChvG